MSLFAGHSRRMRVSLADVAERAGVSKGTVSHVLNENTSARIAPATQERVRQVAAEMGYRPNIFARSLLGKQTKTLGLMIAGLENPFFVEIAKAMENAMAQAGYQALLYSTMAEPGGYPEFRNPSSWPVDGLFVWSRDEIDLTRYIGSQMHSFPVIYLGYEDTGNRDYVAYDLYSGARKAMEYLVSRGYKRIASVRPEGAAGGPPSESRGRVYLEVCNEIGQQPEYYFLDSCVSGMVSGFRTGMEIGAMPASQRPDALFCYNDTIAFGACQGLRRSGLRIPEDIGVTGFDGIEIGKCLDVPLTTVLSPPQPLAAAAVSILRRRLSGDLEAGFERVIIPTELVIGQTTR